MVRVPPELRHKFSAELLAELDKDPPRKVIITFQPGIAIAAAVGSLAALGAVVEWSSELTHQVSINIDENRLPELASLQHVANIYHVPSGTIQDLWSHSHFEMHMGSIVPVQGIGLAAVNVTLEETANYIGAPKLWDKGFRGKGIRIGFVDTGVDKTHPMLEGKVVAEKDFTKTTPEDLNDHGTWVASALGGKDWMSDKGPLIGMAPEAELVSAKAFAGDSADLDVIMAALEWAAQQGCHIISNSWGTLDSFPPLQTLIRAIVARGQIVVAAVGNQGPGPRSVNYPGGYPEVIAVGSIGITAPHPDALALFSSRGPAPGDLIKPDLVAPGGTEEECIWGAAPQVRTTCFRGSSMATPHVAGAIALMLSAGMEPRPTVRLLGTAPNNDTGYGALSLDPTATPVPPRGTSAVPTENLLPLAMLASWTAALFGVFILR